MAKHLKSHQIDDDFDDWEDLPKPKPKSDEDAPKIKTVVPKPKTNKPKRGKDWIWAEED